MTLRLTAGRLSLELRPQIGGCVSAAPAAARRAGFRPDAAARRAARFAPGRALRGHVPDGAVRELHPRQSLHIRGADAPSLAEHGRQPAQLSRLWLALGLADQGGRTRRARRSSSKMDASTPSIATPPRSVFASMWAGSRSRPDWSTAATAACRSASASTRGFPFMTARSSVSPRRPCGFATPKVRPSAGSRSRRRPTIRRRDRLRPDIATSATRVGTAGPRSPGPARASLCR